MKYVLMFLAGFVPGFLAGCITVILAEERRSLKEQRSMIPGKDILERIEEIDPKT